MSRHKTSVINLRFENKKQKQQKERMEKDRQSKCDNAVRLVSGMSSH